MATQQTSSIVGTTPANGKTAPQTPRTDIVARVRAARGCLKNQPGSVAEFLKEKRADSEREA